MTRETKFRGIITLGDKRRFKYGDYLSQYKDGVTTHYIVEHPYGRDAGRAVMWPIDPETLGEYTGLKDKNSKEIYEGDVVAWNTGEKFVVRWFVPHAKFLYRYIKKGYGIDNDAGSHEVEIIGNIYENPELLK